MTIDRTDRGLVNPCSLARILVTKGQGGGRVNPVWLAPVRRIGGLGRVKMQLAVAVVVQAEEFRCLRLGRGMKRLMIWCAMKIMIFMIFMILSPTIMP